MSESSRSGMSLMSVLFIVFLVLKLTSVIAWSWWWVTAPLWGGLALILIVIALCGIAAAFFGLMIGAIQWFLNLKWLRK